MFRYTYFIPIFKGKPVVDFKSKKGEKFKYITTNDFVIIYSDILHDELIGLVKIYDNIKKEFIKNKKEEDPKIITKEAIVNSFSYNLPYLNSSIFQRIEKTGNVTIDDSSGTFYVSVTSNSNNPISAIYASLSFDHLLEDYGILSFDKETHITYSVDKIIFKFFGEIIHSKICLYTGYIQPLVQPPYIYFPSDQGPPVINAVGIYIEEGKLYAFVGRATYNAGVNIKNSLVFDAEKDNITSADFILKISIIPSEDKTVFNFIGYITGNKEEEFNKEVEINLVPSSVYSGIGGISSVLNVEVYNYNYKVKKITANQVFEVGSFNFIQLKS